MHKKNINFIRKHVLATPKILAILFVLSIISAEASAQNSIIDSKTFSFNGRATLTTKGISTFPNLTLGKPAAIFDFSAGGEKFRFEPTMRFELNGKPWTFIFWLRYELLKTEKFQLKIGGHPAYSFKTITVNDNGSASEVLRVHQYYAGEFAPVFFVAKNVSAGPYYIYANGASKGATQNSHFISLRVNFSNIQLNENFFLRLMAQAYYLKMDDKDGTYVNSSISLNRRNFPFTVSSSINKTLNSTIQGDDFLWNINLTYSFGGKYGRI